MNTYYDPISPRNERVNAVISHFQVDDFEIQNYTLAALGADFRPVFDDIYRPISSAAHRGD